MKVTEPDPTMSKGAIAVELPSATGGTDGSMPPPLIAKENLSLAKTRNLLESPSRTAEPAGKVWQSPQ